MSTCLRLFLAAALVLPGLDATRAGSFDAAGLETIPFFDVINIGMDRYKLVGIIGDKTSGEIRKEIEALDPKVQTLVWLVVLENGLTPQTEANDNAPSAFVGTGTVDAPIQKALGDAGLATQAVAFAAATARQGPAATPLRSLELGRAFGTKAAFEEAIIAYARATPATIAWCETASAHLSDEDRLRALLMGLGRVDTTNWLRDWPEPYRVLALADMFDGEVGNGGIHQYFYNSSGDVAPQTVEAMRALGLPRHADAITKGMSQFPPPYPTERTKRLRAFAHKGETDWDRQLDALTEVVGYEAVKTAMVVYARKRDLLPR